MSESIAPTDPTHLLCTKCQQEKPIDAFARKRSLTNRAGRQYHCRECTKAYQDEYCARPENRARAIERAAAWAQANPDRVKAVRKTRRETDRKWAAQRDAYVREWRRADRARNPEKYAAQARAYYASLDAAGKWIASHRTRLRRERAPRVPFTAEQLRARLAFWGHRCWMCGGPATEVDHVKPLAKGGWHCLANLRPACKSCNCRKNDAWPWPPAA